MQVECGTVIFIIRMLQSVFGTLISVTVLSKFPIYCDASRHNDVTVNENVSSLNSAIF